MQPSPRAAARVSPTPGRWHTPTTISPSILETEQDAEKRHAVDEAARAVDGVDEPAVRRAAGVRAKLLADNRMRRIARGETRANEALGADVGRRHRRPIGLELDVDSALVMREHERARVGRKRDGCVEVFAEAQ